MKVSKWKQRARYRETQERVLRALAAAYENTRWLDEVLKEITDKMWDELRPELQMIIEKYQLNVNTRIDLTKYPAIREALVEARQKQHWRMLDYQWMAWQVITESMAETYKQASVDTYAIMGLTPAWLSATVDPSIRISAEVRITDTYITSEILPIPWCGDGKVYSQRLYEHTANFFSKLDYVLSEGISNGRGMEWMIDAWQKLVGATAYDAARLIKTETMAMYNRGLKDSYLEMGVEYVEIVGDAECGGICLDYVDGDPIPLEDAELNVELPPYHPNCACSFVAYEEIKQINDDEDLEE